MFDVLENIKDAHTLPGSFYSDNSIFKVSIDRIFVRSWHLITDTTKVSNNGSAYPFFLMDDLLPEPLFLINNNGVIECYSNVCTHRGNLLIDKPRIIKNNIVCGYHGRIFNSLGKFISMPETAGMNNFPSQNDNLKSVACSRWKQFIFSSLSPEFNLEELTFEMQQRVGWMPVEKFVYREDLSSEYLVEANWALYCDNYLEGFHIPFIHQDLNTVLDYKNYTVETFPYSSLQIGYGNKPEDCFVFPKESVDYGKNIAAFYFWLFPNIMFNFYPWGLSLNIITPLSVDKTRVEFKAYVWKEELLDIGAGADVNKVELEDQEIVQKVQKGVKSRLYKKGRFSPRMENGVHHFHRIISKFMQIN